MKEKTTDTKSNKIQKILKVAMCIIAIILVFSWLVLGFQNTRLIYKTSDQPKTPTTYKPQAFKAPEGSAQFNGWLMVECASESNCKTADIRIESLSIPGVLEKEFNSDAYPYAFLANEIEWSIEYAFIGCDNNEQNCAKFLPPEEGFELDRGLNFTVPAHLYVGLLSCDITRSCDRSVEAGKEYTMHTKICNESEKIAPVRFRIGFDWLQCRGSSCKANQQEYLSADRGDWYVIESGQCITLE